MQRHYEITALERAFQLAKSGRCSSVQELRTRLMSEGYSLDQITGRVLSGQLLALIKAARSIQERSSHTIRYTATSGGAATSDPVEATTGTD